MDKEILISIYPEYLKQIHEGKKNFEFRPFKFHNTSDNLIMMWVYETRPVMMINTLLFVKNPILRLQDSVSGEYRLGKEEFIKNVENNRYAYEIIEAYKLKNPISLVDMKKFGLYNAPQNYLIVNRYDKLLKRLEIEKGNLS